MSTLLSTLINIKIGLEKKLYILVVLKQENPFQWIALYCYLKLEEPDKKLLKNEAAQFFEEAGSGSGNSMEKIFFIQRYSRFFMA